MTRARELIVSYRLLIAVILLFVPFLASASAQLNVQPNQLDFGQQVTGSTSEPLLITISNVGSSGTDLEVTSISISGDFHQASGGDCPPVSFSLSDGESCTQGIEFSPMTDGLHDGGVSVGSDANEVLNDFVFLEGEGVVTDAELTIDPLSYDFMSIDIDAPAECVDFTLANTPGSDWLTIGTAHVDLPFSVSNNCDGSALAGGGSCVIEVCFDPETEDTFSELLTVTSDVNNVAAPVEGRGVVDDLFQDRFEN